MADCEWLIKKVNHPPWICELSTYITLAAIKHCNEHYILLIYIKLFIKSDLFGPFTVFLYKMFLIIFGSKFF